MAADIRKVFAQIKEDITSLTKTYPGHGYLIKSELYSLNEFIEGVYKSLVAKPSGAKQPRTSNARRKMVDRTYKGSNKVKGKEINESQEHDLGGDGAKTKNDGLWVGPNFSGDTSTETTENTENSGREKRKRQEGPENSSTTEECIGDRNSAALPRLEISASSLPKEHNSSSSPITLSDSSPDTPQVAAWDSQIETLMYNWSCQTNLPNLLEIARQLPDGALFNLPRNEKSPSFRVDKASIVEMLTQLQPRTKRSKLSDNLVDYFLSRMVTDNDVQVLDSYWYSLPKEPDLSKPAARLDIVSGTRTLIPCFKKFHWSCIEVDQKLGTITHYDSLLGAHCCATGGWTKKAGCGYCRRVGDIFSTASASLAPGGWNFLTPECQQQDNGDDCGVFMLSNLQNRARGLDLDKELFPDQCRFNIAIGLVRDILAAKATEDIVQAMSSDIRRVPFEWVKRSSSLNNENTAPQDTDEERWAKFEVVHQSQGWVSQLKQMAQEEPVGEVGWKGASRLLQLVANIASPLALVEVKRQLAELRRHQPKPRVSSNHLHGAYFAGVWHDSNTLRSSMCGRVISWFFRNEVVRRMTKGANSTKKRRRVSKTGAQEVDKGDYGTAKKSAIDCLIGDIRLLDREVGRDSAAHSYPLSSPISVNETRTTANNDKATEDEMKRRIRTWYQIGGSWSRLATAAGSPACLCLLPSGTNIIAEERPIYASEYRDLPMCQAEILGTLLSLLRPRMRGFFPKELYEAFLRNSPPRRRFQIESWSDDWICSQSLDSDELAKAFELQSEELAE